jgi:quercetin dioxygenase-like cupin family protein
MTVPYLYIPEISKEMDIPKDGILSRPLYSDDQVRVVLFGFSQGQELSEHTASMPALLQVIQGEARIGLGKDKFDAQAGAWVYMPPQLPHSIVATTPLVLLLVLVHPSEDSDDE